jgi:hypothetical protein
VPSTEEDEMKRLVVLAASLTLVGVLAPPASAARNPKPTVEILGVSYDTEFQEHTFAIDAHDPDGVITEVTVQFGDRSIAFASTFCVIFGPGEVAHMRIGHAYESSGNYVVRAWATSVPECTEWGYEHHQTSHPDVARFHIEVPG